MEYHLKARNASVSLCRISLGSLFRRTRSTGIVGLVTCRACLRDYATLLRTDVELADNELERTRDRIAQLSAQEEMLSIPKVAVKKTTEYDPNCECSCGHINASHRHPWTYTTSTNPCEYLECRCLDFRPVLET